ncbi:MAG: SAM-dependent methyltransferase, partial [Bacteroidales bacterium]|nr:SAM-dependent methyltransferase [Candidatus Colimorpha onthohippi]
YIKGKDGSDRINGYAVNLLDQDAQFITNQHFDVIWMSQFLDCFSEMEIERILSQVARIMDDDTQLYIMETFWNRQKYDLAAFCLTMTSLYFTAMANGNSKMYHSDDMERLVNHSGLKVNRVVDNLGHGHSIMICKRK